MFAAISLRRKSAELFHGTSYRLLLPSVTRANAVISATADLNDRDLEEVTLYALFRRARAKRRV